jgi:hypothetical protein
MPVMITLNKIRAVSPCVAGWEKVLKAHKYLGMDTEFPLSSVLYSNNLYDTLWCFYVLPEHIEIPKRFALWCARDVQHLITDEICINVLDVAERYLDGNATGEELEAAVNAANACYDAVAVAVAAAVACAVLRAAYACYAADAAARVVYDDDDMRKRQINKLREMLDAV